MDLAEELLGLIDALSADGIEYAICGGVALAIHGHPRFTKDIDLLIRQEDLERARAAVARRRFALEGGRVPFGIGGPHERVVHRISKVEGRDVLTLDLLIVSAVLDEVWKTREAFEWRGRNVTVVSTEGLRKMKRLAGRSQDLADLESLGLEEDHDEKPS
jgi:hypothetical protein